MISCSTCDKWMPNAENAILGLCLSSGATMHRDQGQHCYLWRGAREKVSQASQEENGDPWDDWNTIWGSNR